MNKSYVNGTYSIVGYGLWFYNETLFVCIFGQVTKHFLVFVASHVKFDNIFIDDKGVMRIK